MEILRKGISRLFQVLNHHIQRVNQAELERVSAEAEHRRIAAEMIELTERIRKMEKENKNSIRKSKQYFDQRLEFTKVLERQKELILKLEAEVRFITWPFLFCLAIGG